MTPLRHIARFVAWMGVGAALAAGVQACIPWDPGHGGSRFPIVGAHRDLSCAECHVGEGPLPTTCEGCHESDRPVPHWAGACTACHEEAGWDVAVFDHSAAPVPNFPLEQSHDLACESCHTNGTYQGLDSACSTCHEVDRPAGHWPGECSDCHAVVGWQSVSFPHDFLPLVSAHALPCTTCHTNGSYEGLDATCSSCHEEDRPVRPEGHWEGMDCKDCHPATTWADGTFVHPTLPLADAHDLECTSCHTNGTYAGLDPTCTSCHEADRPAAHFAGDCGGSCHPATVWADGHFDHTFFPTTLAHDVPCASCHTNGTYEGLEQTCTSCHDDERPAGHFTGDCGGSCHPVTAWGDGHFNHSFFPLSGGHAGAACADCHTNGTYEGLDDATCSSCHAADVPAPNHYAGQDCDACHTVATWVFNHQPLFPIPHRGVSACGDCHLNGDMSDFSCTHCHEHRQSEANSEHQGINNYSWNSDRCFACHPDGRE